MKTTFKKIAETAIKFDKENKRNIEYFESDKYNKEFRIIFNHSIYHFENNITGIPGVHTIEMYARDSNDTRVVARLDSFACESKILYIFYFENNFRGVKSLKDYFTSYCIEYGFENSYYHEFTFEYESNHYNNYSDCLQEYYNAKNGLNLDNYKAVQIVKWDRLNNNGVVVKTTVKN